VDLRDAALIEVSVPVRICDNGGWTDTWFGGPGKVLNIAVRPGVTVTARAVEGESTPEQNPLVGAAIEMLPPPPGFEITVASAVPAGCGAGTSAAVCVATLGVLGALRGESRSSRELAYLAHSLEVDVLRLESGIQDQLSAAFGGINYIEIDPYPEATAQTLPMWDALDDALTLVFLGHAHDSSAVHREVIASIGDARRVSALDALRAAAVGARDAVLAQDLAAFGEATIANTEAQRALHPQLVGTDAEAVIELARAHGAIGWKVNGAGGAGGSVTLLSATRAAKAALGQAIASTPYDVLPARIATTGLQIVGDPVAVKAEGNPLRQEHRRDR
jgi:D-glycero-alpha-D-manno-heptose-7-phosphate kinase